MKGGLWRGTDGHVQHFKKSDRNLRRILRLLYVLRQYKLTFTCKYWIKWNLPPFPADSKYFYPVMSVVLMIMSNEMIDKFYMDYQQQTLLYYIQWHTGYFYKNTKCTFSLHTKKRKEQKKRNIICRQIWTKNLQVWGPDGFITHILCPSRCTDPALYILPVWKRHKRERDYSESAAEGHSAKRREN